MKAVIRYLTLAFFSLFLAPNINGQKILYPEYYPPDVQWDNIMLKGGETSQTSLSVLIDSRGFVWSGTDMGLYRYDGVRFIEYGVDTGTGDGFTGFTVATIFEDSERTIWIGTSTALNKLDQKTGKFSHYIPDPADKSETGNFVRGIREAGDGKLWVLTKKNIYSFDRNSAKFICYITDSSSWYPQTFDFTVEDQCYAEDKMGNIWFVTFKNLYLFENGSKNFSMVLPDKEFNGQEGIDKVKCVKADRDGNIWIGTDGAGLLKWNYATKKAEKIEIQDLERPVESIKAVSQILQDRNGSIWSFGNGSFLNYNPQTQGIRRYDIVYNRRTLYEYPINDIFIDQAFQFDDRSIWFLNKRAGLVFKFSQEIEKLSLYRTPSFAVNQCVMDKTGSLWFACNRNNLFRLLIDQVPYCTIPVKTTSHVALIHRGTFIQDNQDNVYFLFFQGIFVCRKFDVSSSFVLDPFRFPDGETMAGGGFKDSRGNLWFGDKKGNIARFNPVDKELKLIPRVKPQNYSEIVFVPLIREDKDGKIWFADSKGLSRININENKFEHILDFPYKSGDNDVKLLDDFFVDSHGDFWILTSKSLLLISMPEMKISDFTDYGNGIFSSLGNNIRAAEDTEGNVYILNARYGIYRFDRDNKSFTKVDIGKAEAGSEYYDLLIDRKDRLWTAHNTGITLYDLHKNKSRLIRTDKLQFDVQSCQLKSGEILFLNDNKLYVFPEDVPLNKFVPPVFFTRLLVNGKDYNKIITDGNEINSLEKLDLPYKLNSLSFEFASLNYLNPERNRYRYFMKGFDRDTSLVGQGVAEEYKNLPPGRYRFWVTGSNNDDIWNPSGISLDIRIRPPIYRSSLAYLCYIFLITFSVLVLIRRREFKLKNEKKRLEEEIKAATLQLQQKNFQLAEIDRIKTHFFTDISHEIRTPLSLILGPLEKLSGEEGFSARISGMIDKMKRNAQRLMNLVNQLLDISRLDAGKMKIMLGEDDIVKCLRILVYEFLSLAESKQIKYIVDLPDNEFITWFDRDKVEKIVTNILSNAFKYTPNLGTVQCIVKVETGNQNYSPQLKIRILDSGPGIAREHQTRVFDRFYRINGHHETAEYGTGIGLSLVQEFVLLLHGEVILESEVNRGTGFLVTIPLGRDHLSSDEYVLTEHPAGIDGNHILAMHPELQEAGVHIPEKQSRIKLLIIEDNEDLRKFIRESLEDEYGILESENGRSGINTAFTMMPDLIVTDIMMPDLDGLQLCAQLKNDERTSHIPIIMLTAKATMEDKVNGLKTGADDYIIKPFNIAELRARISNLLIIRQKLRLKYSKIHLAEADYLVPESVDDRFMIRVLKVINENIQDYLFDVRTLTERLGMSRSHLNRKIRILTGLAPGTLIRNVRLERAAKLLSVRAGNITEIANSVGISNPSNFAKAFRTYFGVSPKNFSRN